MRTFKDIFVIQLVGLLANRRFSGDCDVRIDNTPAQLQFAAGCLIGARFGALIASEALTNLLWAHKGEIALVPRAYMKSDWNFVEDMDKSIAESSPSMPNSCPFMQYLSLERSKLNPQNKSAFMMTGLSIYSNIRSGGTGITQVQKNFSQQEFWKSLFHLFGSGQVIVNYGQNLNPLLLKVQNGVIANLQKVLGKRAAQLYQERLSQSLNGDWPDWPKYKAYDPFYGTAPYRTWLKLLSETIVKVASTTLGDTCYKKALALLTPEEADLLQQLLD